MCNLSLNSVTFDSSGILYHISHYHSFSNISNAHTKFEMFVNIDDEPISYRHARTQKCWVQAMNSKLQALQQNKIWIFVDIHSHIKPIGIIWVYKEKLNQLIQLKGIRQD